MHSAAGCRRTRVGDAYVPNRCQSTSGARHASRNPESCVALDGASAARESRKHVLTPIADSSQSLSPFEKTLCTFTRNARPPSAQLKSTQTRPAASVNCHLCSTMTCFGWPRWLRGRGPSPRDPIRAHQAVSAPAKNHGLFWRRHISSGVDQRWSLTPRATPSSRSDCAVYCRSSLMPSSP